MTTTYVISGAGSGIGRASAVALAATKEPMDMILIGRRTQALEETAALLPKSAKPIIVGASQSDQEALSTALKPLKLESRGVTGVVANAGVGGENEYGPKDRWRDVIDTNLSGTYYLVNECLPGLKSQKGGPRHVVIISSILARLGIPGYTAYCASKAGLLGLMRSWAAQYAKQSIYFNAICPGWVNTDMARDGINQYATHTKRSYDDMLAQQMSMVPTGKMAEPEEVGSFVAYLMSKQQSSFTGQCFDMNNGALMP